MTEMDRAIAYIALGSNLGDRRGMLRRALGMLGRREGVAVRRVSGFVETEPLGPPGQGKYLNAAAEVETTLSPEELLGVLQQIEAVLGRSRAAEERYGPRMCDLDILLMGQTVMQTETLTIPHPRMHERLFVLRPLAEIAPSAVHPRLGLTVAEMLADAEVVR